MCILIPHPTWGGVGGGAEGQRVGGCGAQRLLVPMAPPPSGSACRLLLGSAGAHGYPHRADRACACSCSLCARTYLRACVRARGLRPARPSPAGTEDRARVLRPPAPASLVGEGALGFCVRRLPGTLRAGEAGVQAGGEPPVSPTAGRHPGARVPRWMQGWLSPSHGLVSRTGLAAFGSRALSHCSFPRVPRQHLAAAGTDGGSGCTWTGDLRPALPFRAGPDPALGTLRLGSRPPASPWPKLNPALVFKSPEPASPDWAWLPAGRACPVPPRGDHTEAAFWLAPGMGRGPCGPRPMLLP